MVDIVEKTLNRAIDVNDFDKLNFNGMFIQPMYFQNLVLGRLSLWNFEVSEGSSVQGSRW